MKIVVDCHGNDKGASVAVQGGLLAMKKQNDLSIVFCGKSQEEYSAGNDAFGAQ